MFDFDMSHCQKCGSSKVSVVRMADHVGAIRFIPIFLTLLVLSFLVWWISLRSEVNLWGALLIAIPSIWIAAPVAVLFLACVTTIVVWLSVLRVKGKGIHCATCGHITKIGDAH